MPKNRQKMPNNGQNAQKMGKKCEKMAKNCLKCPKMAKYGQIWRKSAIFGIFGIFCCIIVLKKPQKCTLKYRFSTQITEMTRNVPNHPKMVQNP